MNNSNYQQSIPWQVYQSACDMAKSASYYRHSPLSTIDRLSDRLGSLYDKSFIGRNANKTYEQIRPENNRRSRNLFQNANPAWFKQQGNTLLMPKLLKPFGLHDKVNPIPGYFWDAHGNMQKGEQI